ncbi:hypothetical protein GCM10009624_15950 [Gordonia sinesedis]
MSVRARSAGTARRLPFGIGTVVLVLCAALVASAGAVLAIGTPDDPAETYTAGVLRDYRSSPEVAWTQSSDTLPDYRGDGAVEVADTWQDQWLLAYPSGLGRAFLLVDRYTGKPLWSSQITVGLGDCAFTQTGRLGCAVKLGDRPDGFYLVTDDGTATPTSDLDDTARVLGVGDNFVRVNQSGYRVTLRTPAGQTRWSRTFGAAASARFVDGVLIVATVDGSEFVLDPATGTDRVSCSQCDIRAYPTGIAVVSTEFGDEKVSMYSTAGGTVAPRPVSESGGLTVLDAPSTLPVLTATGDNDVMATQGRYEIRDPAQARALWTISDPELSKANARPCGSLVSFARKDGSRVTYRLRDGRQIAAMPAPDSPDRNISTLSCVGSSADGMVFVNANQLTAFSGGRVSWEQDISGSASAVDGYIVVTQGTTVSVLRPN